jgi:hypothetical protein
MTTTIRYSPHSQMPMESLGKCVCGGEIYANVAVCAVAHSHPACAKFLELEPDEFLVYVRRARGIPDPQ